MGLIHSFENSGNWLFKYRGQLPLILFLAAIPVIYFTNYNLFSSSANLLFTIFSVFLSFLGLLIRAYTIGTTPKGTSGRNTNNQVAESLNQTGIYSLLRHPLYLGNYLIWMGIVLYTQNISFFIISSLTYWLYYERIMFAEERFLERKFGQIYVDWTLKTSAFIPSFKNYIASSTPFSFKSVLRREYSGFLATTLGFIYVDLLKKFFTYDRLLLTKNIIIVLSVVIASTVLLKTIKHNTNLLNESDRS